MLITRTSPFTGITRTLDVPCTEEQYAAWEAGMRIQEAMPNIPAGQREFIMTGISEDEWEEAFPSEGD